MGSGPENVGMTCGLLPNFLRRRQGAATTKSGHKTTRPSGTNKSTGQMGSQAVIRDVVKPKAQDPSSQDAKESLPTYQDISDVTPALDDAIAKTIEETVNNWSTALRELSLDIHSHPELAYQEEHAHRVLTSFMGQNSFNIWPHHLGVSTAWKAEWASAASSDIPPCTIGINSEMDALPGIGHACGHNLIAIAGVGVALAVRRVMEVHQLPGRVVLLGTPAEENGAGKQLLLDKGAYQGMDVCFMCHPTTGPPNSANVGPTLAMKPITVEYFGHSAHAGAAPWAGTNALDAAFIAYSAISVLRQQMEPDHRVHGLIEGGEDWAPNVIPDYAKMRWICRAPTLAQVEALHKRVENAMQAGALATGCRAEFTVGTHYADLRQNSVLTDEFFKLVRQRPELEPQYNRPAGASTDFGNVTYALPALHPGYAIPTVPNGGNHTAAFTEAAATMEAHQATLALIKTLSGVAVKVLTNPKFYNKVRSAWEDDVGASENVLESNSSTTK